MSDDEDENEIKPGPQIFDLGVVGIAAFLTLSGIGLCFFTFKVPMDDKPKPPPAATAQPTEVTVGIGSGSTIRQAPPAIASPAHP